MTTEEWLKKINQDAEKLTFLKENKNLDKVWLLIQKKTLVLMKKMYTFFPQAISLITLFFFQEHLGITPFIMDKRSDSYLGPFMNPILDFLFSNYEGCYESFGENTFWTFLYSVSVFHLVVLMKHFQSGDFLYFVESQLDFVEDREFYQYDVDYVTELLKLKKDNLRLLQKDDEKKR